MLHSDYQCFRKLWFFNGAKCWYFVQGCYIGTMKTHELLQMLEAIGFRGRNELRNEESGNIMVNYLMDTHAGRLFLSYEQNDGIVTALSISRFENEEMPTPINFTIIPFCSK